MKISKLLSAVAASAFLLSAPKAFAGSATSNMSVSASVAANCTISAGALSFGSYDPVSANAASALNGTATLTVACTSGASANIVLDQGSNADTGSTDTAPLRRLKNGTSYLSYDLYSDSGRTTIWGNTAGTGAAYTGTGSSASVTVYGSVAAGQNVPSGSYTDTVVATINF